MSGFVVLPHDVHSVIWSNLELQEIARLRQTCSSISDALSNDKQLWIRIFNEFVKARSLPLPQNIRHVEELNTHAIECCIKHSLLLSRNYARTDRELRILKPGLRPNLRITWVKLILGHWCLIASSNDDLSELSLWEIIPGNELRLTTKIYLEAPIIDGQVDQHTQGIRCAITVGSSRPYILILSINQDSSDVSFKQLAEIPNASHVRLLRGDLAGFAVRNGDDAFPFLSNWKLGRCHRLKFPHVMTDERSSPFPIEPCIAMTLWEGYVFTMHRTAIRVFAMSGVSEGRSPEDMDYLTTFPFQNEISGGHFFHASESTIKAREGAIMYVWFQDLHSSLHRATIFSYKHHEDYKDFSMVEEAFENPPNVLGTRCLNLYQLGPSQSVLFCVTSMTFRYWRTPRLLFAILRKLPDSNVDPQSTVFPEYVTISTRGLPLPHLITSVDFDDGNGLLLLATFSGDVRVVSMLPHEVLTLESVRRDLGVNSASCSSPMPPKISDVVTALELPLFYTSGKPFKGADHLPPELLEQAAHELRSHAIGLRPLENWSNDWPSFEHIWDWMAPFPLWGLMDPYFTAEGSITEAIRDRLRILGEMIPILYDTRNHCRVIFRVGERIFYCKSRQEVNSVEDIYDFEDTRDLVLGVLPITYGEFLLDPRSILPPVSDHLTQRNVSDRWMPLHQRAQLDTAWEVIGIRDYWKDNLGVTIDDDTMQTWTKDDWDENHFLAAGIKPYPSSDPEDQ